MKPGSRSRDKLTRNNSSKATVTSRKAFAIVNHNHSLVFHRDGCIMIFYSKKRAKDFLDGPEIPEGWRYIKVSLDIEKYEK